MCVVSKWVWRAPGDYSSNLLPIRVLESFHHLWGTHGRFSRGSCFPVKSLFRRLFLKSESLLKEMPREHFCLLFCRTLPSHSSEEGPRIKNKRVFVINPADLLVFVTGGALSLGWLVSFTLFKPLKSPHSSKVTLHTTIVMRLWWAAHPSFPPFLLRSFI